MSMNHSTERSYRIHQFLRGCLVVLVAVMVLASLPASGGAGIGLNFTTLFSAVLGWGLAYIADWTTWAIAEGIGGKNGLLAPATV